MKKMSLSRFFQRPVNIWLCCTFGWQFALSYIHFLGRLYFFFNRSEKQRIRNAVRNAFGISESRPYEKALTRHVFRGIFSHYYEKLFNVYSSSGTIRTFFETHIQDQGLSVIKEKLSKNRGVLLVTGHYGGVEFLPGYLSVNGIPVSIVVDFATEALRKASRRKAAEFSIKTIDVNNTRNIVGEIRKDLKANRVVITQCDEIEKWRPGYRDQVTFLGAPIFLDRTLNTLIQRVGAETVFGLMHRDADHRYRFVAADGQEIRVRTNEYSIGRAALKWLEKFIMTYPDEWYQWKKYFDMPSVTAADTPPVRVMPVHVLGSSMVN